MIIDLFIAGSETTSNTINWCILYLMEKPEVQKRCFEEIRQVVSSFLWFIPCFFFVVVVVECFVSWALYMFTSSYRLFALY